MHCAGTLLTNQKSEMRRRRWFAEFACKGPPGGFPLLLHLSGSSRPATATISASHITSQSPLPSSSTAPPDPAKTRSPVSTTLTSASLPDISRPTDHQEPKTKGEWKWPDQTGHLLAGLQLDGHKMFVVIFSERLWLREEGERGQRGQLGQAASMVVRLGPTKSSADSLVLHHMFSLPLELGIVGHTNRWSSFQRPQPLDGSLGVLRDIDEMHTFTTSVSHLIPYNQRHQPPPTITVRTWLICRRRFPFQLCLHLSMFAIFLKSKEKK